MRSPTLISLAALALFAACSAPPDDDPLSPGHWRAWLDSPGGELPFGLELRRGEHGLEAVLINGPERLRMSGVDRNGPRLTLSIPHYDARVEAAVSAGGRRLDGHWEKTGVGGTPTRLEFHAVVSDPAPASPAIAPDAKVRAALDGRWAVDFERSDDPAVGVFETGDDGSVSGTFLTTTGDYRYLAGSLEGRRLRLSCFDGAHAFLFHARLDDDGTLSGDFWSRDTWHETWTARRDPDAALPDPFGLTHAVDGVALEDLVFPDLDGRERSLADEAFAGRARIVEIFGSWCPNCNDAAPLLVELDREYRARGLSIVGVAFEMTGDFDRDAEQLRVYAEHHGIDYPLLVAGTSDKKLAGERFPLLDRVRSYPTTIFLHGDGRVRAVHQGFEGPATGEAHRELRERFESLVVELLAD